MILDAASSVLRLFPAETAHKLTIRLTRALEPMLPAARASDRRLAVRAFGRDFPNPIGLAAGFDKNAEVPDAMLKFGFGFVECGTVTPRPQSGNPRPRLFRLTEDRAVVNRMGFNNDGMEAVAERLSARPRKGILGINIGANKDSADRIGDYFRAFARLAPLADYVAVNVSSPNTAGLRDLQNRDELSRLLSLLTEERAKLALPVPLLLKIAPDLDGHALDDIASVVTQTGIEGVIVSNTTIERPSTLVSPLAAESGGLSGVPLMAPSTHVLREMRQRVGSRVTLIGTGGVSSGADAYAKIRSGATLVQLYSALAFQGPGLIRRIKRELLDCLVRDGFSGIWNAIGADIR
jgi:dihydroorotate dehydrogenase